MIHPGIYRQAILIHHVTNCSQEQQNPFLGGPLIFQEYIYERFVSEGIFAVHYKFYIPRATCPPIQSHADLKTARVLQGLQTWLHDLLFEECRQPYTSGNPWP